MSKAFFGSASERYLYFGCFVKPEEVFDYYEIDAADLQEDADNE